MEINECNKLKKTTKKDSIFHEEAAILLVKSMRLDVTPKKYDTRLSKKS